MNGELFARMIETQLINRFDKLGVFLSGQVYDEATNQGIAASGKFLENVGYSVERQGTLLTLHLGSNVEYEKYIFGGKVPSWTPTDALIPWVKQKGLQWVDQNGKEMSAKQMAFLIARKHSRVGIKGRNVVQQVMKKRESWIISQLENLEVDV